MATAVMVTCHILLFPEMHAELKNNDQRPVLPKNNSRLLKNNSRPKK